MCCLYSGDKEKDRFIGFFFSRCALNVHFLFVYSNLSIEIYNLVKCFSFNCF